MESSDFEVSEWKATRVTKDQQLAIYQFLVGEVIRAETEQSEKEMLVYTRGNEEVLFDVRGKSKKVGINTVGEERKIRGQLTLDNIRAGKFPSYRSAEIRVELKQVYNVLNDLGLLIAERKFPQAEKTEYVEKYILPQTQLKEVINLYTVYKFVGEISELQSAYNEMLLNEYEELERYRRFCNDGDFTQKDLTLLLRRRHIVQNAYIVTKWLVSIRENIGDYSTILLSLGRTIRNMRTEKL